MVKSMQECLEQIDYLIYSKYITPNTIISKQSTHLLINHLDIKDYQGIRDLLNSILLEAEQKDTLLTHKGLQNLIINKYSSILLDFVKTEKARRYLE